MSDNVKEKRNISRKIQTRHESKRKDQIKKCLETGGDKLRLDPVFQSTFDVLFFQLQKDEYKYEKFCRL